jgi:uncharacterized membrane protein YphA (DoxX/SURF4 family)
MVKWQIHVHKSGPERGEQTMTVVAALLSIALFLAFASAGIQKLSFNPAMSKAAEHLGFTKRAYQRIAGLEIVGAIGLLIGCVARGSSWPAIVNEVVAAGLVVLMLGALIVHLRNNDKLKYYAPAVLFLVATAIELAFRLAN